ncbi:lipoprotein, putative [Bacillus cereus ATCC 10987]|uniref:Lipoprotein, putative n=1 Tax=Bacillus cereus (strain ATCC 10987 / NRS 248) TaxID=222523 RepID=Q738G5_BACC1|nr:lipoprotein, putative [Bacillus cereus ATCC 10987]
MDRKIYYVLKKSIFCFGIVFMFLLSGCISFGKETTGYYILNS